MGVAMSKKEARRRNTHIERELAVDRSYEVNVIKILLLGKNFQDILKHFYCSFRTRNNKRGSQLEC